MATTMKTPGVYVVEKNAFPNGVVQVATAVPAFIGYTEIAEVEGKDLTNTPYRITSLTQFEKYFGKGPAAEFTFTAADKPAPDAEATPPEEGATVFNYQQSQCTIKQSSTAFMLYNSMRFFYQNSGGPCYVVSVGNYGDNKSPIEMSKLQDGIAPLIKEQEPTMVLIPETVKLASVDDSNTVHQAMLQHCGEVMKNRVAILDLYQGDQQPTTSVTNFRNKIGINNLDYGMTYYPWLNTTVVADTEISYLNLDDAGLSALQAELTKELTTPEGAGTPSPQDDQIKELIAKMTKPAADMVEGSPDAEAFYAEQKATHNSLMSLSGLYRMTMGEIRNSLNLLAPGSAMAGIYTMVDNQIGVWKAPANVSLNSVISPAVDISAQEQEDLNVPIDGKAINAIRTFIGEGVLVWGARTLDGNSLDWRYINVRRTMIMLEESIRQACKAYVFEPNTANTWVTMQGMINSFLQTIWKQGGLAGSSAAEAFSVEVGLGTTMDSNDILEGILRVSILVAITRPAEFIEITFTQQMQKS